MSQKNYLALKITNVTFMKCTLCESPILGKTLMRLTGMAYLIMKPSDL